MEAPAGSGKTTALAAVAASMPPQMVTWLNATPEMDEPTAFAATLIGAVRRAAGWSAPTSNGGLRASPLVAVRMLVNDSISLDRQIVLFIDGYERISHPDVHMLVGRLVEEAGPNWRFRIASQTVPPLPIARWRSQMVAAEMGFDDLCLGPDATGRLLRDAFGLRIQDDTAENLADRTGGWVTGVLLAGQQARATQKVDATLRDFGGAEQPVVEYVSRQILQPLEAAPQRLVLKTSGLIRLCAELCGFVSSDPAAPLTFRDVATRHTFLRQVRDSPGWYEHLRIFQDAFRAIASMAPDDEIEVHRRAREWSLMHGHVCDAIEYMMRGDQHDVADAASMLAGRFDAASDDCPPAKVLGWIGRIPTETVEGQPTLRLVAVRSALESRRLDVAARHLAALEAAVGKNLQSGLAHGWLANRIDFLIYSWQDDAAMALVKQYSSQLADAVACQDGKLAAHLTIAAARVHWLAGAKAQVSQLLAHLGGATISLARALERHGIEALIAFEQGDRVAAEFNVDRVLTLVEHIPPQLRPRRAAYGGLATLWSGRTPVARWVRDCVRTVDENLPGDVECIRALISAELAWRSGEQTEAASALSAASSIARRFKNPAALDELIRIQAQQFEARPPGPVRLSPAERAVLEALAHFLTNAQIAERLYLSRNTIKTHLRVIFRKLGVQSRTEAVAKAEELGLLAVVKAPGRHLSRPSDPDA